MDDIDGETRGLAYHGTTTKLLVAGKLCMPEEAEPVIVQRGMLVFSRDGALVGAVAAVVARCPGRAVLEVLFGQLPPNGVYRRAQVALIAKVADGRVWLQTSTRESERLPKHQPE